MRFNYSALRGRIVEVYSTLKNFAEANNIRQARVSEVLNGNAFLDQREVVLWADCLNISEDELFKYFFDIKDGEGELKHEKN